MKKRYIKEAVASFLGGLCFIILYLVLDDFILALILGLLTFVVMCILLRYLYRDKSTIAIISEGDNQITDLEKFDSYIKKMKDYEKHIADDTIQKTLHEIILKSEQILEASHKGTVQDKTLNSLTEVYFPSIDKICNSYLDITSNGLDSEGAIAFKESMVGFMSELSKAFTRILNNVYSDDILDASTEISVLKSILKSQGLTEQDELKL